LVPDPATPKDLRGRMAAAADPEAERKPRLFIELPPLAVNPL
jgi:hypothetical protein